MGDIEIDVKEAKAVVANYWMFDGRVQAQLEKTINKSLRNIKRGAMARVSSRGPRVNSSGRKLDIKSRIKVKRAKFAKGKLGGRVISAAPHSYLVEYGTKPHSLDKGAKRKIMVINGHPVSGKIMHPGAKKKPFMLPSYMQERPEYLESVKNIVKQEVDKMK